MIFNVEKTSLEGVLLFQPKIFSDDRGHFAVTFEKKEYASVGLNHEFVQDNESYSLKGVLRGLHTQIKIPQAKLVRVSSGEVFDVAVDARLESVTFGKWYGTLLSETNKKQLFVPAGCLHGFVVLSDTATVQFKCTSFNDLTDSLAVKWDDPSLAIDWPIKNPIMSLRDQQNPSWEEAQRSLLDERRS